MTEYPRLRLLDPDTLLARIDVPQQDAAASVITEAKTADMLVEKLNEQGAFSILAKSIFHMLTPREAVWGACLLARLAEGRTGAAPSRAHRAAELWVRDQNEDVRYKAYQFAQEEKMSTPGAWSGMAAFVSGPSLAPIDAEKTVAPTPELGALAASTGLNILVASDVLDDDLPRAAAGLAMEVAAGSSGLDRLAALLSQNQKQPDAGAPAG